MATLYVDDYIDVGTKGYPTKCSWEVARDANFTDIIDSSYNDTVNVLTWNTPLPDGNGWFYSDLVNLYSRVKVFIDNTESPWFVLPVKNQQSQTIEITYPDGTSEFKHSSELWDITT